MATFKAQLRINQENKAGESNIKIRVSHGGKVRYIKTTYNVLPEHFDNDKGKLIPKMRQNAGFINNELGKKINEYEKQVLDLGERAEQMDIGLILTLLKKGKNGKLDFYNYLQEYAKKLETENRGSYPTSFYQTEVKLKKFTGSESLLFSNISFAFLESFRTYCIKEKLSISTFNHHCRNIRTLFNHAIDRELISPNLYPFKKLKMKRVQTIHRSIDLKHIAKLRDVKLEPFEEKARDLWLLSFYLIGINFKDLLLAKHDQVKNGRLYYERYKGHKKYSILIPPEALEIISKYTGNEYVLNFIELKQQRIEKLERTTPLYKDITDQTNHLLKSMHEKGKIEEKISTYYARHSWASIASFLGVSKDVIAYALGHGIQTVTDIYIDFDITKVDKANEKILKKLGVIHQK